ncbi:MAG: hypothetical protein HY741_24730 [Chloroflexi bacterium]|nr:hypothetical protein [Chloroflexota bacterium]
MNGSEAFSTFLFLCVFVVLGSAAIGAFVRTLLRREAPGVGIFFLIWGSGFGGIPLLMGGAILLPSERPALFYALVFVFVMAIMLVALMPSELFQKDASGNFPTAIVGAILAMFGAAVLILTWREGLGIGLLFGGGMAIGGVVILFRAVLTALHAT